MAQDPLFDPPAGRLPPALHQQVFGSLPTLVGRALDRPEVACAVRPLLERGWRPAHIAARVGALPASDDPVPAVVAFLDALLERSSPLERWHRDRAAAVPALDDGHVPAAPEARAQHVAQARKALGLRAPTHRASPAPPRPVCAACRGAGAFFVTRQVRLCAGCVALLSSGRATLAVTSNG